MGTGMWFAGEEGIEPPMAGLEAAALPFGDTPIGDRRDGRIRTFGFLLPKQADYQTVLHPGFPGRKR